VLQSLVYFEWVATGGPTAHELVQLAPMSNPIVRAEVGKVGLFDQPGDAPALVVVLACDLHPLVGVGVADGRASCRSSSP
jgi:hypothetical protein